VTAALTFATVLGVAVVAQDLTLPNKPSGTLKFAAIGDSGTGDSNQYRLAKVFADMRERFAYEFVLMMGDNMYGRESARTGRSCTSTIRFTHRVDDTARTRRCATSSSPSSSSTASMS
jgi:hypothetical protein